MPTLPSPAPLHLLQVLGGAESPGEGVTGVERVVQALIQNLDARRYAHYLAYPEAGELLPLLRSRVRATLPWLPRKRYDRAWMEELGSFLRAHGIRLVLTHGWRADFLTALVCRRSRTPHVVARAAPLADEATLGPLRRWLYTLVDTWTLRGCVGVVTVSQASKERMRRTQRLQADHIKVIPNGVRVPVVSPAEKEASRRRWEVEPGDFLVGAAGRLVPGKGFDTLLDAMAIVQRRSPELALRGLILGEGPERRRLEARALSLGVSLRLPGFVEAPYAAMAAFDVAVLPSHAEGMPLVVLETMALGVPTVATAVGGCSEIIDENETGLFIPVGDARALAEILTRLALEPAARRRLGEAGARAIRRRYTLDAMVRSYDAFLTHTASRWYGREGPMNG